MDRDLTAAFIEFYDLIDMFDLQFRIDPLREHIISNIHDIHVTGTLSVAEQCAFHTFRPCQHSQFGACHAGAPVIVGMHAENNTLSVFKMCIHPFDPVRKDIRRRHFHSGGQVYDHRVFPGRSPDFLYRRTNLQRKVQFRPRKTLRRIFQHNLTWKLFRPFLYHFRTVHSDLYDLLPHAEHHIALQGGCRIINMDHRLFTPLNRLKSTVDQLLTALCQNLYQHIIRYQFPVYKLS